MSPILVSCSRDETETRMLPADGSPGEVKQEGIGSLSHTWCENT